MCDYHIHIGQFNEIYYDALEIFEIIEKVGSQFGINEIHYSSTSSCRDDVELEKVWEEKLLEKADKVILTFILSVLGISLGTSR